MELHFLITDKFLLMFIAFCTFIFLYTCRNEATWHTWRRVFYKKIGVFSALILFSYFTIGIFDSIHLYKPKVGKWYSLLDIMVEPITGHAEKTYSQPFALQAFNKETRYVLGEGIIRNYPRLAYIPGKINTVTARNKHIKLVLFENIFSVMMIIFFMSGAILLIQRIFWQVPWRSWFHFWRNKPEHFPWLTFWLTLSAIFYLVIICVDLIPFYHLFGTNKVGADVFYLSLKGIRTGLMLGTITTLTTIPLALTMGVVAGYFQGWIDDLIQYIYTTISSVPGVLLIAAMILSMHMFLANHPSYFSSLLEQSEFRLLLLCIILGLTGWTGLCRLVRGETLKLREMDYVLCAKSLATPTWKILYKHIMPNVMHIVLISAVLDFSGLVLAEAVLSYVGIGVDPMTPSWGNMINSARLEWSRDPLVWWPLGCAFIFMFLLVLAANCFADCVQDAFDPKAQT